MRKRFGNVCRSRLSPNSVLTDGSHKVRMRRNVGDWEKVGEVCHFIRCRVSLPIHVTNKHLLEAGEDISDVSDDDVDLPDVSSQALHRIDENTVVPFQMNVRETKPRCLSASEL